MKRTQLGALALVIVFAITSVAWAWKREFGQKFASKNSWEKKAAIANLDPNEKDQLKMLFKILKLNDWYLRQAAWKTISNVSSESSMTTIKKELKRKSSSGARIREGLALAMGIKKDRSMIPNLLPLLKDRSWQVKRSTANALAMMPDKRSVGPLIDGWKKNTKRLRVWVNFRLALEKITGQFIGNSPRDWGNWWAVSKDRFTVGSGGGDSSAAEAKGHKTKKTSTVLRGVKLDYSSRGKGPPLFVLPDFGYNEKYILPYLAPLEDIRKIFYIKLPPISSFKNPKRVAGRIVYPVDQLCDAFDALRKQYKQKRIGIMGHGVSAWVAMRYATKYPKHVRSLIIVSSWPNQMGYRRGVEKLEALGKRSDQEMMHFAQSLQIMPTGQPKYQPKGRDDQMALMRKEWTLRFADQGDAVLGGLQKEAYKPSAGAIVPDFDLYKEPKGRIPALVIFGRYAQFTSAKDGQKMAQHFGGRFMLFPRSRRTPFIEENERFIRTVRRFFGSK